MTLVRPYQLQENSDVTKTQIYTNVHGWHELFVLLTVYPE